MGSSTAARRAVPVVLSDVHVEMLLLNLGRSFGVFLMATPSFLHVSCPMLAALDVQYDEAVQNAISAAVTFDGWAAALPTAEYVVICQNVQPYEPGQFYKRELPCLQAVLEKIPDQLEAIVIDGYVNLGDRPGLGLRLWEAFDRRVPIIGVAKTKFHSARAVEVLRGKSRTPLYVTAAGISADEAAKQVAAMAGAYRLPALLKRVDQLARQGSVA